MLLFFLFENIFDLIQACSQYEQWFSSYKCVTKTFLQVKYNFANRPVVGTQGSFHWLKIVNSHLSIVLLLFINLSLFLLFKDIWISFYIKYWCYSMYAENGFLSAISFVNSNSYTVVCATDALHFCTELWHDIYDDLSLGHIVLPRWPALALWLQCSYTVLHIFFYFFAFLYLPFSYL